MKQTAVEFLIEEIKPFLSMPIEDAYKTILQAKEMETEQIKDAYNQGHIDRNNNKFKLP
jgi:hypothetical protein